jgi:hypothetical protein
MHATDPQEQNTTDMVNHFKNQAQRFKNAYDDLTKKVFNIMEFLAQENERLSIQKSMPDAPKEYILEAIAANEARHPPLDAKLKRAERIKERLIEETNIIFENAIQSLAKPDEEESKDYILPN